MTKTNGRTDHYNPHSDLHPDRLPLWLKLLALALLIASTLTAAGKLSNDLKGLPQGSTPDVIVQFTHPPEAADIAVIARMGGKHKKISAHTGSVDHCS